MHTSTTGLSFHRRDAAPFAGARWLAVESDNVGSVDTDSLSGELHQLFEGAVVVSEWDDEEPSFDDIEFDD